MSKLFTKYRALPKWVRFFFERVLLIVTAPIWIIPAILVAVLLTLVVGLIDLYNEFS